MNNIFATNFTPLDWTIVVVYLLGAVTIGVIVNRYIHSVADYLVTTRDIIGPLRAQGLDDKQ